MWGRREDEIDLCRDCDREKGREKERPIESIVVMSRPRYNHIMGGVMQPK